MCNTCGCDHPDNKAKYTVPGQEDGHPLEHEHSHEHNHPHDHVHEHSHNHDHEHEHTHHHSHGHEHSTTIQLEQDVLIQNNMIAQRNRGYFEAKNIVALNMVSSPGSGKTSLLEKTITDLKKDISFYVIEGDQQTMNDAYRIKKTGAPVIQINTGNGCHLDADMINKAAKQLNVSENSMLIIENVGNLVCPSMFDLGESFRVVVISVTEGDDKPLKYPGMFHTSNICIINKIDLIDYVDFNIAQAKEHALKINPDLKFFEVSAKTGQGMEKWYEWLKSI